MDVITYPCWDLSYAMLVKGVTGQQKGTEVMHSQQIYRESTSNFLINSASADDLIGTISW